MLCFAFGEIDAMCKNLHESSQGGECVCVCVRSVMTVYIIHVCVFAARLFKSGREGVKSVQDPRRSSTSLSPRQ